MNCFCVGELLRRSRLSLWSIHGPKMAIPDCKFVIEDMSGADGNGLYRLPRWFPSPGLGLTDSSRSCSGHSIPKAGPNALPEKKRSKLAIGGKLTCVSARVLGPFWSIQSAARMVGPTSL
jgi:hypothetical protein